jgi:hypothetical protein
MKTGAIFQCKKQQINIFMFAHLEAWPELAIFNSTTRAVNAKYRSLVQVLPTFIIITIAIVITNALGHGQSILRFNFSLCEFIIRQCCYETQVLL